MASDLPAALQLTEKQAAFVAAYVEYGDSGKAAEAAGYGSPVVAGYRLAKHPALLAAIRYETAKRLQGLAPVALRVLAELLTNDKIDPRVRRQCAVDILSRAGHVVPTAKERPRDDERPHAELTEAELTAMLQAHHKRQAEEAQLVQAEAETERNAPTGASESNKTIDMFE